MCQLSAEWVQCSHSRHTCFSNFNNLLECDRLHSISFDVMNHITMHQPNILVILRTHYCMWDLNILYSIHSLFVEKSSRNDISWLNEIFSFILWNKLKFVSNEFSGWFRSVSRNASSLLSSNANLSHFNSLPSSIVDSTCSLKIGTFEMNCSRKNEPLTWKKKTKSSQVVYLWN